MSTTTENAKRARTHQDCEKDPCQLCARRQQGETCGSCLAGICIMETNLEHFEVERCDVCALFETDEDAADAVRLMLELLHKVYKRGLRLGDFTVADAAEVLRADVLNAPVLRQGAARALAKGSAQGREQQLLTLSTLAQDVLKGALS